MIDFDHNGNTYGWAADGKVYSKKNNKYKDEVAESLEDFLKSLGV